MNFGSNFRTSTFFSVLGLLSLTFRGSYQCDMNALMACFTNVDANNFMPGPDAAGVMEATCQQIDTIKTCFEAADTTGCDAAILTGFEGFVDLMGWVCKDKRQDFIDVGECIAKTPPEKQQPFGEKQQTCMSSLSQGGNSASCEDVQKGVSCVTDAFKDLCGKASGQFMRDLIVRYYSKVMNDLAPDTAEPCDLSSGVKTGSHLWISVGALWVVYAAVKTIGW